MAKKVEICDDGGLTFWLAPTGKKGVLKIVRVQGRDAISSHFLGQRVLEETVVVGQIIGFLSKSRRMILPVQAVHDEA